MAPADEDVTRFAEAARAYCRFVREASSYRSHDRLVTAARLIATLYAAALSLPEAEPSDAPRPSVERPVWDGFDEHDFYWEVADPLDLQAEAAVVCGSLSDDLLDIYLDVSGGLACLDAGLVADAVWHWRLMRETHWGSTRSTRCGPSSGRCGRESCSRIFPTPKGRRFGKVAGWLTRT